MRFVGVQFAIVLFFTKNFLTLMHYFYFQQLKFIAFSTINIFSVRFVLRFLKLHYKFINIRNNYGAILQNYDHRKNDTNLSQSFNNNAEKKHSVEEHFEKNHYEPSFLTFYEVDSTSLQYVYKIYLAYICHKFII